MDNNLKIIYGVWIFVIASSILFLPLISANPDLTDNLISFWKLDESSGDVLDAHGDNDGTNDGATPNVAGKINTAYSFDGSNDYINLPDINADINTGYTLSAWIKTSMTTIGGILTRDGSPRFWQFRIRSGKINFIRFYSGGNTNLVTADTYNDGDWHFVVATFSSSIGSKIYVDGVEEASDDVTNENIEGTGTDLTIGTIERTYGGHEYYFDGIIDEVSFWSRYLTQEEVTQLWNSGDGLAYPFVVDTCTCPGTGNNWEIDMSDYCNITEACDLTTGKLSFTGSGFTNCNATINTTNLGDTGSSGILYIQDSCLIEIN